MTVEIRVLTSADAAVLDRMVDGVFDDPIRPDTTAEFLADARHSLCVAIDDGVVVGMASAVRYVHPDKPSELWINEVGVAPSHQRRGLAKAILTELLAHGKRQGCREAWVLTDEDNAAARATYASVGGREKLGVVQVDFRLG
jgi:ribosomal protein S18 acetylase RimI-like enzyme